MSASHADYLELKRFDATHWMPLPPAPGAPAKKLRLLTEAEYLTAVEPFPMRLRSVWDVTVAVMTAVLLKNHPGAEIEEGLIA